MKSFGVLSWNSSLHHIGLKRKSEGNQWIIISVRWRFTVNRKWSVTGQITVTHMLISNTSLKRHINTPSCDLEWLMNMWLECLMTLPVLQKVLMQWKLFPATHWFWSDASCQIIGSSSWTSQTVSSKLWEVRSSFISVYVCWSSVCFSIPFI